MKGLFLHPLSFINGDATSGFSSNEDTDNNVFSLFKGKKILNISKDVFQCSSCIASGNLLKKLQWQRQVFMSKSFGLKPAESEGVSRNEAIPFQDEEGVFQQKNIRNALNS